MTVFCPSVTKRPASFFEPIMNPISSASAFTALSILQMREEASTQSSSTPLPPPSLIAKAALKSLSHKEASADVFKFLGSAHFTTNSAEIFDGLVQAFSDPALQDEFSEKIHEEIANGRAQGIFDMDPDNARNNALFDVIIAHREDFPPEEFSITFTTGSGAWGSTTIPSLKDMPAYFAEQQVAYPTIGARNATPDKDSAKLDALQQAVNNLVLNGAQTFDQGSVDAQAAYAILTQKLFSDDEDHKRASVVRPWADGQGNYLQA